MKPHSWPPFKRSQASPLVLSIRSRPTHRRRIEKKKRQKRELAPRRDSSVESAECSYCVAKLFALHAAGILSFMAEGKALATLEKQVKNKDWKQARRIGYK